jgi:hypothetical protein
VPVRTRWILAVGLAVIGLVWIGQGLGLLRGSSFMVDDIRWAIAGAVLLVASVALAWRSIRDRSRA